MCRVGEMDVTPHLGSDSSYHLVYSKTMQKYLSKEKNTKFKGKD
jgi:hypothetical protein